MTFNTDNQTLQDLSISTPSGQVSILQLFKPITLGGMVKLKTFIDHPLTDITQINNRLNAIKFLHHHQKSFTLNKEEVDFVEFYLKQTDRAQTVSKIRAIKDQLKNKFQPSNEYYVINRGVSLLFNLISYFNDEFKDTRKVFPVILSEFREITNALAESSIFIIKQNPKQGNDLSAIDTEELDFIFRYSKSLETKRFLEAVYQLDVLHSVAHVAIELNFCYPEILTSSQPKIKLNDFFHPFIKQPIKNDIGFEYDNNICFLTGANMAGKSTTMKSMGVCVYLAHVGFPVPASAMQTTIFNGLFTTINLSDNLAFGHSHFYSEVLRIKEVALHVGTLKNIVVIFDELFRGTNVKDAYDASLTIIRAFSQVKNSIFIISTHIVEVADELKGIENMFFKYLGTTLQHGKAVYDYKLQDGISNERLGMKIIEDEGLVEIIKAQVAS